MFFSWKKSSKDKEDANASAGDGAAWRSALVRPDPRTSVKTTSAQAATSNTSTQSTTIINNNKGTITYQTTRQTVTSQQTARVTEIVTRRTPTIQELKDMMNQPLFTRSDTFERNAPRSSSSRSAYDWRNESANGATPPTPTLTKTFTTTFDEKNGSKVTKSTEVHRIKLSSPNSPLTRNHIASRSFGQGTALPAITNNDNKTSSSAFKSSSYVPAYRNQGGYSSSLSTLSSPASKSSTAARSTTSSNFFSSNAPKTKTIDANPFSSMGEKTNSTTPVASTSYAGPSVLKKSGKKPTKNARAYILNNKRFDGDKEERIGTEEDVKSLRNTFDKFKIKSDLVHDATVAQIQNMAKKLSTKDFSEYGFLVIVILTHGDRHDFYLAKDDFYDLHETIVRPLLRNKTLEEKPKIFFIQACKGRREVLKKDAAPFNETQLPSEILFCYSTFERYVAYRSKKGSFFVRSLCANLQEHGNTKDIQDLMKLVMEDVKRKTKGQQTPSICSSLTKKVIFGEFLGNN